MQRAVALGLGILAWIGVAAVAVASVNAWSGDNQVLAFLPIIGAVVVAWAVGEVVTARVFGEQEDR